MDSTIYTMTSDYSALSSAIENNDAARVYPTASDVTSASQNSRSSFSDDTISEPVSPQTTKQDTSETCQSDPKQCRAPGLSYIALISMAIQSSREKRMLLSEIYQWISERYPYYDMKEKSWRNSIRHNLSLNECFVKNGRSENGKGNYWSIHPANIEDFAKGDYRRRRARRRVRKCDEDLRRLCTRSPYPSPSPPATEPQTTPEPLADGYVPMMSTPVPTSYLSSLGMDGKPRDEWNFHNFPYYTEYKSRDANFYCGESCPPLYHYQQPEACNGMYTASSNKPNVARPNSNPASGEVNVNVNVNVYGNAASSQRYHSQWSPSYNHPQCPQASKATTHGCPYTGQSREYPCYGDHGNDQTYPGCTLSGLVGHGYTENVGIDKMSESKD